MPLEQIIRCHEETLRVHFKEKVHEARVARLVHHAAKPKDFNDAMKPMEDFVSRKVSAKASSKSDIAALVAKIGKGF